MRAAFSLLVLSLLRLPSRFPFSLWFFKSLIIIFTGTYLFSVVLIGVLWASWIFYLFFINFGNPLLLLSNSSVLLSFSSRILVTLPFDIAPLMFYLSVCSSHSFFLFSNFYFSLGNFYWLIFPFIESSLSHTKSTYPIERIFRL